MCSEQLNFYESFNTRRGFTLLELLVVVGIITLLIGILVPCLSRAREAARSAQCQSNLHAIGQAIKIYMGECHDYYPPMALIPSIETSLHPINPRKPMAQVLGPYTGQDDRVFRCPSDRIINLSEKFLGGSYDVEGISGAGTPPAGVTTWFDWQRSSYQSLPGLSIVSPDGRWLLSQENRDNLNLTEIFGNVSRIPLLGDYEGFHPRLTGGSAAGMMILFADFHVEPGNNLDS